uniref:Uncharacterized protein n=1 Tax=Arundo donax TaxID=35708 RepID=A0A0A8Z917_ARUDO
MQRRRIRNRRNIQYMFVRSYRKLKTNKFLDGSTHTPVIGIFTIHKQRAPQVMRERLVRQTMKVTNLCFSSASFPDYAFSPLLDNSRLGELVSAIFKRLIKFTHFKFSLQ